MDERKRFYVTKGNLSLELNSYGAALRSCKFKGRELTLGYEREEQYDLNPAHLGSTIGRFANRLAGASVKIDGTIFPLDKNEGENTLHGGKKGFDRLDWRGHPFVGTLDLDGAPLRAEGVRFSLVSPDGDQGFPGTLRADVLVFVSEGDILGFYYEARTEKASLCNLTNHAYWNLAGEGRADIRDHELKLYGDRWFEVDGGIPNGKIGVAEGGTFDFRDFKTLGGFLSPPGSVYREGSGKKLDGIDHCFLLRRAGSVSRASLDGGPNLELRRVAELRLKNAPTMEVLSSKPGFQIYTSHHLSGMPGRKGALEAYSGLCVETQYFPDAPNQAAFFKKTGLEVGWPEAEVQSWDAVLRPGTVYRHLTLHRFTD